MKTVLLHCDVRRQKYHNILNVLHTQKPWVAVLEGGGRSNVVAWGRLDPIPLCYRGLHLLSDIYHTVKSDIALVEEAPHSKSPKPISGGRKERGDFRW